MLAADRAAMHAIEGVEKSGKLFESQGLASNRGEQSSCMPDEHISGVQACLIVQCSSEVHCSMNLLQSSKSIYLDLCTGPAFGMIMFSLQIVAAYTQTRSSQDALAGEHIECNL